MSEFSFDDIINKKEIDDLINKLNDLKLSLKEVELTLLSLAKVYSDKSIKEFNNNITESIKNHEKSVQVLKVLENVYKTNKNSVSDLEKSIKNLSKEEQELQKVKEKLKNVDSDLNKELIKTKVALKDLMADLKATAKEEYELQSATEALKKVKNGELKTYAELYDALGTLKVAYKSLVAAGKENEQQTKEIYDTITVLDTKIKSIDYSVGEFQKNVGNYANSFSTALDNTLEKNFEFLESWNNVRSVAISAINDLIVNITRVRTVTSAATVAVSALGKAFKGLAIAFVLDAIISGVQYLVDLYKKRIDFAAIDEELTKAQYDLEKSRIFNQLELLQLQQKLSKTKLADLEREKEQLLKNYDIEQTQIRQTQVAIAQALRKLEIQVQITNSEEDRKKAKEKILELEQQYRELDAKVLEIELKKRDTIEDYNEKVKQSLRDLNNFILKSQEGVSKIRDLFINAQTSLNDIREEYERLLKVFDEDITKIQQIQAAAAQANYNVLVDFIRNIEEYVKGVKKQTEDLYSLFVLDDYYKKLSQIRDKYFEEEEKRQEKLKEVEKELNELRKIYAQNQYLFSEKQRKEIEENIKVLENQLFLLQKAKEKLEEYYKVQIENEISKVRKEIDNFYQRELSDLEKINRTYDEQIKKLREKYEELDRQLYIQLQFVKSEEEREKIMLDIFRLKERLSEAEIDLERRKNEEIQKIKEKQQKDTINSLLKEVDKWKELRELEIKATISEEKKRNEKLLRLQREYLQKRIEILSKAEDEESKFLLRKAELELKILNDNIEELQKEKIKEVFNSFENVLNVYKDYLQKVDEINKKILDVKKEKLEEDIDYLFMMAERGSVRAEQSIAILQRERDRILQQELEMKARQQRIEAYIAVLKAFASIVEKSKDSKSAIFEAISSIMTLQGFAKSLPAFYEGTEEINKNNAYKLNLFEKDDYIVRVHEGERIVPADINQKLKGIKNEDLPKLLEKRESISFDYDSFENVLVSIIKRDDKIIKNRIRL